jgi:biotin carboxyl carrier protein
MRLRIVLDGEAHEVELGRGRLLVDGEAFEARAKGQGPFHVLVAGKPHTVELRSGEALIDGEPATFEVAALAPATARASHHGAAGPVLPPMPGRVVEVRVAPGQQVRAGQCLVLLEAMKMQNEVPAPADGTVQEVRVRAGQVVEARDVLVVLGEPLR